jgi:hypothetical protein
LDVKNQVKTLKIKCILKTLFWKVANTIAHTLKKFKCYILTVYFSVHSRLSAGRHICTGHHDRQAEQRDAGIRHRFDHVLGDHFGAQFLPQTRQLANDGLQSRILKLRVSFAKA